MKKILSIILLAAVATGCANAQNGEQKEQVNNTVSEMTPKEDAIVQIETTEGPITVLLYGDTPAHRDNFLKLAEEGFYDGLLFHRVIKDFMVQAGDPDSKNAAPDKMLGSGDPGYTLPAEINYPKHYHKYGALAAARTGDAVNPERRSSGSQFYIVTGTKSSPAEVNRMEERMASEPRQAYWRELMKTHASEIKALQQAGDREGLENLRQQLIKETESKVAELKLPEQLKQDYTTVGGAPHLDGQYTVFGEVTDGMETVEKIQNAATGRGDRPVEDIKILSAKVIKK